MVLKYYFILKDKLNFFVKKIQNISTTSSK